MISLEWALMMCDKEDRTISTPLSDILIICMKNKEEYE